MKNIDKIKELADNIVIDIKKIRIDPITKEGKKAAASRIPKNCKEIIKVIKKIKIN